MSAPSDAPSASTLQQGVPGVYTCTQSVCGGISCSPTGVVLQCVNAMMEGYNMEYNGVFMQCYSPYGASPPYNICTCLEDFSCDSSSSTTTTPVIPASTTTTPVAPVATTNTPVTTPATTTAATGGIGSMRDGVSSLSEICMLFVVVMMAMGLWH